MRGRWLAFVACALVACESVPTWDGYEKQLAAYNGKDVNELIMVMGEPTRRTEMERGYKVYVWEQMSKAHTDRKIVEQYNPETGRREFVEQGGERIPFDCTTTVFADAAGLVTKATAEGVACLGFAPAEAQAVPAAPAPAAAVSVPAVPPAREPVAVPEAVVEEAPALEGESSRAEKRRVRLRQK